MNWKYLAISTVVVLCFFLWLASAWHGIVGSIADLYLEAIVIKPEGVR